MGGQTLQVNGIEYYFTDRQLKYRELFKNNLYLCTKYLCGFHEGAVENGMIEFPMNWHLHGSILTKVQYSKWTRLALKMPRGSFKSCMMTVGLPIWKIINNPNIRIGVTGGNMSLCKAFLQQQKDIILSPFFRAIFPEVPPQHSPNSQLSDWSQTQYTVHRETTSVKEPTVYLFTQGSKIEGWHFDLIIADDCVNRENYKTEVRRNHVKEFFDDFTNLVNNVDTPIVWVYTPWHPDDAHSDLEKRESVTKLSVPLYDGEGNVFFPEKFTARYIKQKRDDLRRDGGGDKMFTTQYLLEAVSGTNAPMSQYPVVRYWEEEDEDGRIIRVTDDGRKFKANVLGTMIPMDTSGQGVDTCGVGVLQRDNDDNFFVRYAKEGRGWPPSRRFKELIALDDTFDAKHLGVEVFGQITIKDLIGEENLNNTDRAHKFKELKHHSRGKDERIMNYLEPKIEAGKWFWHIGVPEPAIKQVMYYREMSQDTVPDMLAYGVQMFEEANVRPAPEHVEVIGGWKPHRSALFRGVRR